MARGSGDCGKGGHELVVVDVDDLNTWPPDVRELIHEYVDSIDEPTENREDLKSQASYLDPELRRLLAGHELRAYHCTRLLDHEAVDVRTHGLRLLNSRLVADKLQTARERGHITPKLHDELLANSRVGERADHLQVEEQISLVPSTFVFDYEADGFHWLLSTWGGEAIYTALESLDLWHQSSHQLLRNLGRPTIVVVRLRVESIEHAFSCLAGPFVAAAAGWPERGAVLVYTAPIPGERIEALWQPGDERYDRFHELPR